MARTTKLLGVLLVGGSLVAGVAEAAAVAGAGAGRGGGTNSDAALRESAKNVQLLVLEKSCDGACQDGIAAALAATGCDQVTLYPALKMASARCAPAAVAASAGGGAGWDVGRLPGVQSVSADAVAAALPPSAPAPPAASAVAATAAATRAASRFWGLDRVNQQDLPLDGVTVPGCYPRRGAGVTVYVLDSGLTVDHAEFGGRASVIVAPGAPYPDGRDNFGHGSHVAGTVAGATSGVAPAATLVGVRMGSDSGDIRVRDAVSAIHLVAAAKQRNPQAKIIINASFGWHTADWAVVTEAADRAGEAGVIFVAAAGNVPVDACRNHPAQAASAITVAAVDRQDRLANFSARGTRCVAVSAPGVDVLSVDAATAAGFQLGSGTSMAAPHVAGLAALVLAEDPNGGDLEREEVLERLTRAAPRVGGYPLAWANPACDRRRLLESA